MKSSKLAESCAALCLMASAAWIFAPATAHAEHSVAAPKYRIQNLGVLPRTAGISVSDINNQGVITGNVTRWGGLPETGFIWRDGEMTRLGNFGGGASSIANKINNHGEVAGMLNGAPGIFRPDGSFLDLTASLGGGPGQAIGINDSGMTTGQIDSHPFFHDGTQGEVIRSLTVRGVDINNNGTALLTAAVESSYLYADSQLTPLSGPSGGSLLAFTAINDLRQVTGSSFFGSTAKTFVYSDGDYHFIDTFGRSANARDINNQGWIVGSLFDSEGELQGFLNRENETLMLKDLLVPSSAKRWGAINPMAINDHGQIIGVGLFHGYNGDYSRAFVATPVPEPNIVVLMLAGLGVLCFATRCNRRI